MSFQLDELPMLRMKTTATRNTVSLRSGEFCSLRLKVGFLGAPASRRLLQTACFTQSRKVSGTPGAITTSKGTGIAVRRGLVLVQSHGQQVNKTTTARQASGSVLPFVVVGLLMMMAFLAFVTEITRCFLALEQLEFAAQSAAIHAYSYATNADGSYQPYTARENMVRALSLSGGSRPRNIAPSGPSNIHGQWHSGVGFDRDDASFVSNPFDTAETFLQLTARRTGDTALNFFFLPAIFAVNKAHGEYIPPEVQTAPFVKSIEIIGQPASRIGEGPPKGSSRGSKAKDFQGFATFPFALGYNEFRQLSSPSETRINYTIVARSSANQGEHLPPGYIKGSFVNVLNTGDAITYYGPAQGAQAVEQLIASIKYFSDATSSSGAAPAVVERGSSLACFDAGDRAFIQHRQAEIDPALRNLMLSPNKYLILPVLANPLVGQRSAAVGFARLQLNAVNTFGQDITFTVQVTESVPVRNATVANGLASIPSVTGKLMPAPPPGGPFDNRIFFPDQNAVSRRPRSVVFAPCMSPRQLRIMVRPVSERSARV